MSDKILSIDAGNMSKVDFSAYDQARTDGIESCIAIATREGDKGTMAHLNLNDNVADYIDWLQASATTSSRLYLVGGWDPHSKSHIQLVKSCLQQKGYSLHAEDTLNQHGGGMNLIMHSSGEVKLEKYRIWMRPYGPEKVVISVRDL